ncbi:MAG: hypothetical protein F4Z31_16485 [Gemmatimonadetes bacterium]|nr:hypothetical protein [Gemmatimonadota bacterium]MYA43328.1 hypothetical protein [Gemmatimonadota bacterium]MYE94091.1 hypothetical protein [Gemmatimonadota bacterium]MYJ10903.1 hypothetical protein [Gemmatimonadota bacterium]
MGLAAVPFTLKRSSDLYTSGGGYESTTETAHGLVRLEADRLVIQWRVAVVTESMEGAGYETREEIEPVREIVMPLTKVAGAFVPERRWWRLAGPKLIITAADLLAFERIAGEEGLKLKHPAKLALRIKRGDRLVAEEFAAELSLAVARLPEGARGAGALPDEAAGGAPVLRDGRSKT